MKIGVFDFEVGSLKKLNAVIKKYPKNKYYYLGYSGCNDYNVYINFLKTKDIDFIITKLDNIDKIKDSTVKIIDFNSILEYDIDVSNSLEKEVRLYFENVNRSIIDKIDNTIKFNYQLEEVCLNYQK